MTDKPQTPDLTITRDEVVGIDNHNDYYDPAMKEARLERHTDHSSYIICALILAIEMPPIFLIWQQ